MAVVHRIGARDVDLLRAFHDDVYLPEFAHQREPFDAWVTALRGDAPYHLTALVATDDAGVVAGVVAERYPRSGCGLVTYLAVAPRGRGAGLGGWLLHDARAALAPVHLVLGEISDPRRHPGAAADAAWDRLRRFQRWGARVIDVPYVQPDLGAGLGRDRGLVLVAFLDDPDAAAIDGPPLAAFLRELYEVVEGATLDPELDAMLRATQRGGVSCRMLVRG